MALAILYSNEQDSFPRASAGTGTITAYNNRIVGSSTLFTTEVQVGDYIYMKTQNAFRRVLDIQSDTELTIDRAFGSAISAASFHITPKDGYIEVSAYVTGAGAGEIDGVSFAQNNGNTWTGVDRSSKIYPIDIDATGTTIRVTFKH